MTMPFYVPPEQLVKDRADFARKGISRGRPIIAAKTPEGILLVGENPSPSLRKIGELYDRIAFAGVGRFNEFELLRVAGVRYADLKGFSYARSDVTGRALANAYSQTLGQIFSHEVKPYEIEVFVAEVGTTPANDTVFRVQFDGTLRDVDGFAVLGADEDAIYERLAETQDSDAPLGVVLDRACTAIEQSLDQEVPPEGWETGFLDRSAERRSFRRLTPDEVSTARD
jgi:proteasome alpha subunit